MATQPKWVDSFALPTASAALADRPACAANAYRALLRTFSQGDLFLDALPDRRTPQAQRVLAHAWPHSVVTTASLDMFGLPGVGNGYRDDVERNLAALRHYSAETGPVVREGYDPRTVHDRSPRQEKYNDDNAWIGLNLMRAHKLIGGGLVSGGATAIEQAGAIFAFIAVSQAYNYGVTARPGGIYWKRQYPHEGNHDVNTCSTAPTAQLALQLYLVTGERTYLAKAIQLRDWVNASLRDRDGLFWDHAKAEGPIDKTKYTYNQGSMMGLNVLLALATGDPGCLAEAEAIARAALDRLAAGGFTDRHPEFKYIFFRNLLYLSGYTRDKILKEDISSALEAYLRALWENPARHDDKRHLFRLDEQPHQVIQQAAVTGMLALSAWDPADYPRLF